MKRSRQIILIFAFFLTNSIIAQEKEKVEILGRTYSVQYYDADGIFEFCQADENSYRCERRKVDESSEFSLIQSLTSETDKIKDNLTFYYLGQDKKLSEFNTVSFNSLTVYLDSLELTKVDKIVKIRIKEAPSNFPEFNVKKIDNTNYELSGIDAIISTPVTINFANNVTTDSDNFKSRILTELDNLKTTIADNYKDKIKVENKLKNLIRDLYDNHISKSEKYVLLLTKKLNIPTIPATTPVTNALTSFNIYMLAKNEVLSIKVCNTKTQSDCKVYGPFEADIIEVDFTNKMLTQHVLFSNPDSTNDLAMKDIYQSIKTKTEAKSIEKIEKEFDDKLLNEIQKLENANKTFSGKLVVNKRAPLYIKGKGKEPHTKSQDVYLIIDSVYVRFFNNRADNISIVGRLSSDKENKRVFRNSLYSLPLREFRARDQTNSLVDVTDGSSYLYYYDDVMDYLPFDKNNYAVKNGNIQIKAGESKEVEERKIGDYFTGIFFSDFLGLNSSNSNGLIVAEGRLRLPINFRNFGRRTLFDNLTVYASANLFSGFESSSRKIQLEDSFDSDETSTTNEAIFDTNNFNLLTNNNLDAGMSITPITFEWKGASTFIHLRYGLRFLRTGVEYNLKSMDSTTNDQGGVVVTEDIVETRNFQVWSTGQEAEVHFEIRPQSTVGGDLTVGLNWFRSNGTNRNDVSFSTTNNSPNLKVMLNLYALGNYSERNSGVYFRLGGHYNLGNYEIFPQIMVGYATNLSSFVNKFKNDNN